MSQALKLQPAGHQQPRFFMTSEQYRRQITEDAVHFLHAPPRQRIDTTTTWLTHGFPLRPMPAPTKPTKTRRCELIKDKVSKRSLAVNKEM